ncbi:DUF2470 domain-containing protein [Saccharothrix sp. ST-888]|uniref:DUF2470 domain-containing protein n=1 Tax=Saccharothrix sp. ST-888 TaxID=1427391 RepID=UPI0006960B39|nr:DUF2470 domain-containing protein [Saccharothrix sp. ST-888]
MAEAESHRLPVATRPQPARHGQAPSGAERARTLLEFGSSVVLDVPGIDLLNRPGIPPLVRCTALPDAALAVLVESASPLCRIAALSRDEVLTAELEAVDVAPVALPHRIRGRLTAHGRLSALPTAGPELIDGLFPRRSEGEHALLRLDLDHLAVEDLWGTECCIDPAAFSTAAPDPIAADEAAMLQHLAASHPEQLRLLGRQALEHPSGLSAWHEPVHSLSEVRPVSLDRYGLRVRLLSGTRMLDARFDFDRPVTGPEQLPEAMHRIFAHLGH